MSQSLPVRFSRARPQERLRPTYRAALILPPQEPHAFPPAIPDFETARSGTSLTRRVAREVRNSSAPSRCQICLAGVRHPSAIDPDKIARVIARGIAHEVDPDAFEIICGSEARN